MTRTPRASPLTLLQLTTFVSTLDRFAMPPMLVAISVDLDAPLASIVQAAGAYYLVYGLCQPLWGFTADRLGRVATMRLTLLLAAISTLVAMVTWSPMALAVARGAAGGFFGAAYPSSLVYVGDTVPVAVRQRDIAKLMVGVAVGTAVASLGAGVIAEFATWRLAFAITGVAALVLVVLLRDLPEPVQATPPPSASGSLRAMARTPVTWLVLVLAFADGVVLLGGITLLPPAMEDAGTSTTIAGAITATYGAAVLLGARVVSSLSQRWHPSTLIALGGAVTTIACLILAVARTPASGIAVAILLGLAWVSLHSSVQTWATEVLPQARATMMAFFASSMFIGSAFGALAVAGLAGDGRYGVIFCIYAAIAAPLGIGAARTRRRWKRPQDTE